MEEEKGQEPYEDNDIPNPSEYRVFSQEELDLLFTYYEKYYGNISEMVLDAGSPLHTRPQITYYVQRHGFKSRLLQIRTKRAREVIESLQDAKMLAVENAMRILRRHHELVFSRTGTQVFDRQGNPVIIEKLPYYKEIRSAWEIIKTELGEPTSINKTELKGGEGGLFLTQNINVNIVDANTEEKPGPEIEPEATPSADPA